MNATSSHEPPNPAERELSMLDDLIATLTERRREVYRAGLATLAERSRSQLFHSELSPGASPPPTIPFPIVVNGIAYGEPHARLRGPWFVTVTRLGAGERAHLGLYLADLTYGARVAHAEPSGVLTIEQTSVPVFLVPALGEVLWAHECRWECIESEGQLDELNDTSIYGQLAREMFCDERAAS
jgi:hypothetical protein